MARPSSTQAVGGSAVPGKRCSSERNRLPWLRRQAEGHVRPFPAPPPLFLSARPLGGRGSTILRTGVGEPIHPPVCAEEVRRGRRLSHRAGEGGGEERRSERVVLERFTDKQGAGAVFPGCARAGSGGGGGSSGTAGAWGAREAT